MQTAHVSTEQSTRQAQHTDANIQSANMSTNSIKLGIECKHPMPAECNMQYAICNMQKWQSHLPFEDRHDALSSEDTFVPSNKMAASGMQMTHNRRKSYANAANHDAQLQQH